MNMNQGTRYVAILLLCAFMALCAGQVMADSITPNPEAIWGANLFRDFRAHQVGDLLLVVFDLSSESVQRAFLQNDRNSRINSSFLLDTLNPLTPILGGANNNSNNASDNQTQRLVTLLSARVTQLLPNGNLMIEASRQGIINKEKHVFTLTGEIRPVDITSDNTISSARIMNLQFNYVGPLTNQRSPGLIPTILKILF